MPRTRRWVDLGDGVEEFVVDEVFNENSSSKESIRQPPRRKKHATSTPSESPARVNSSLITPPNSNTKRASSVSVLPSQRGHDDYEHKLTVLDSRGLRLPWMVFRWYNPDNEGRNTASEIRAGLFKKENSPVPPPLSGDKLKKALLSHLTPEKKLSPFISVFQNFLPALHRALKSEKEAYVAIIDLRQAVENSRGRFPDAAEVAWPIKVVIKRYGFQLRNHYKGNEWVIHGIVENSAIIKTIRVSDLRDFAHTGCIQHMREVLDYITEQRHAFGLLDRLKTKLPKTGYHTGTLVGEVLDFLQISDEHQKALARKIKNMMKFEGSHSLPRQRAYLRGVYGMDRTDSDIEIDAMDEFIDESDDGFDSNADYVNFDHYQKGMKRSSLIATSSECASECGMSDMVSSLNDFNNNNSDTLSSSPSDIDQEQTLLDAQLHATEREWLDPTSLHKTLRMSHVEIPKLTAEQMARYKITRESPDTEMIDLTNDADDEQEDVIEVAPWSVEEDIVVVASAPRENRTMSLAIRTTSTRSTIGPQGLARLEADAGGDVMEVMQFD